MGSGPITSWQIEGENVEAVTDFVFLGSKVTVDGDCSHEIRCVLLGRKAMTNLDSGLKSRDVTLPTMVCIMNVMVFPVVMHGCENWIVKKAEYQRVDAFEMWCWRRPLRVPWTRRSIQLILKEINTEYSLEGLMLKLKLQYFGHLIWTANSLENPWCWGKFRAEGEEGIRGWDGRMVSSTQWPWTWANSRRWWVTGRPTVLQSMRSQRVEHNWLLNNNNNKHTNFW